MDIETYLCASQLQSVAAPALTKLVAQMRGADNVTQEHTQQVVLFGLVRRSLVLPKDNIKKRINKINAVQQIKWNSISSRQLFIGYRNIDVLKNLKIMKYIFANAELHNSL